LKIKIKEGIKNPNDEKKDEFTFACFVSVLVAHATITSVTTYFIDALGLGRTRVLILAFIYICLNTQIKIS
jgi:hypothetical protein